MTSGRNKIKNSATENMSFRNGGIEPSRLRLPIENSLRAMNTHKITNASVTSPGGGALGAGDRGGWQSQPDNTGNPYDSQNYIYRWRQYVHLYELSWEARKIIRIPVEDALRKPWKAQNIPEEMAEAIMARLNQLGFENILRRSLMLERLLGGCITFFGLEGREDDVSKPYHPSEGARLSFCNAIPISRISRVNWDTNPMSEHYMRPDKFLVNGEDLHVSRALIWDGDPLFDPYDFALTNFRANLAGFGPSKLAPLWDDIVKAVGTRQAAYQLIQLNNAMLIAVNDLPDINSTNPGRKNLEELKNIANQLSLYRSAIIDKEKATITQSAASFGSVPELMITFLQIICGGSDIPATRFIGQAPGGLNATGESDLENYYNVIDAYQRQRIEPALRRTYDIIGYNKFGQKWRQEREKLEFEFPPLWNASEIEQADTHAKQINNILSLHEAGMISDMKVIEELNSKNVFSVKLDDTDLANLEAMRSSEEAEVNADEEINKLKEAGSAGAAFGLNAPESESESELQMGIKAEQEHSGTVGGNEEIILKIVQDHLKEDPHYYSKLQKAGMLNKRTMNVLDLEIFGAPTSAQISAGNYKKHHLNLHGIDIAIENPKGSERSGASQNGKKWSVKIPAHYGYIKRTEGADGDHVDVYIGDNEPSELVFVIDQIDPDTGAFDEHKCILGCMSEREAVSLYKAGFSDGKGKERIGAISPMHISQFKSWLDDGALNSPIKYDARILNASFKEEEHPRDESGQFAKTATRKTAKVQKESPKRNKADEAAYALAKKNGFKIRPDLTDVWVNPDPKGFKLATGKDSKGHIQTIYSAEHQALSSAKKFARIKQFTNQYSNIMKNIENMIDKSEEAKVLYIISKTGFRVGSEKDTGAETKAYGASTLRKDMVSIRDNSVIFDFIGKHGVGQKHIYTDPLLVNIIKDKLKSDADKLFDTDEKKILKEVKKITGSSEFKTKDFRTYVATGTALSAIQNIEPPKNLKEYNNKVMEVSTIVSKKLGNTPEMARDSYIDPTVFADWKSKLGGNYETTH